MPEVLEVLKQAETVIANLLSYRYASSPPTDLEFRQARRTLSALRAACESSALPAASDGMPPLPRSSLMMFPCRTVCFVAADMHTYASQRNATLEARLVAANSKVAALEFAVFKTEHRHQYTPVTKQSAVLHILSGTVIWIGHDTGTELSLKQAFVAVTG